MSDDLLLIGWVRIHRELFIDDTGKVLISIQTLERKYGPGLKASGVIFEYCRGQSRIRVIAGWKSVIQNYFIKLGQKEDAERRKAKLVKKTGRR